MDNIQYDPVRILDGFTEDSLRALAKKLKRRSKSTKREIIEEILSPPKGAREDRVKVWQEMNRYLRKDLEGYAQEGSIPFSSEDGRLEEQFRIGYMLTLSVNPEIRTRGEEIYTQAEAKIEAKKAGSDRAKTHREVNIREEGDTIDTREVGEAMDDKVVEATSQAKNIEELIEERIIQATETKQGETCVVPMGVKKKKEIAPGQTPSSLAQVIEKNEELQKKIRTLESKLRKVNIEGIRTKERLEKLKKELLTIKSLRVREIEEAGKYRNRVKELEEERTKQEIELEVLKQKYQQNKPMTLPKAKIQPQRPKGEIDLASFQGRKALIFAERNLELESKFKTLGIIPIWAMDIDWNRPRRRMSTCEIVLYQMNDEKLKKLDEIRDIARYLNIPCNELMNINGRLVRD